MNVTKLDLCKIIAEKLDKPVEDIKNTLEIFLDEVLETLARRDRIEIRGFGAFSVKTRKPRLGRNPRNGEVINIPQYDSPHFKFSKEAQNIFDIKSKQKK